MFDKSKLPSKFKKKLQIVDQMIDFQIEFEKNVDITVESDLFFELNKITDGSTFGNNIIYYRQRALRLALDEK